ncbi:chemotaxis protein CheW [Neobacillus sp. OS1-32]|uniref:Purine-binding chemotaxis protein CheW n=1 Tax=Neobacillus paridis TaxID=2803862 RepID=A0ABS1TQA3_9BACI|nr:MULTISPECIES: chemotaxis protein CheW [Neobacillus]MBL4952919.1 purine-binding chemotaxis protein CheW [Neobacillus paridis]WML31561.1 chemotaxis protein CheW [Neobacillus sp. OS1-32]
MNRKIVAFQIGEEEYGLDINNVQSIERIQHITRVPNAPDYVEGVMNLRGNVTPVIDLRKRLKLEHLTHSDDTRVIITKYDEIEFGIIVDQINDVTDIKDGEIEAASSSGLTSEYFAGIAKTGGRLIILLKIEELIKTPES